MRIPLVALSLLIITMPTHASACEPDTARTDLDTGATPIGRFYVVNELITQVGIPSLWVYEESNGIDGLQRGDEIIDNTCGGAIAPDTLIL